MKNNLLKSVAAAATASALLFSTVTSFAAATATTVTTYKGANTVSVKSTISGVTSGTMVTYLASKNGTVNQASDILYIGQQTSAGNDIEFEYMLSSDKVTIEAGKTLAEVKYGSDDTNTATALNAADTATTVAYGNLKVTTYGCTVSGVADGDAVGNGKPVEVTITAKAGYEIDEVSVNGVKQENAPVTVSVPYNKDGMELVAICKAKTENVTRAVKVMDITSDNSQITKSVGIVCSKHAGSTANIEFGVYAKKADGTAFALDSSKYSDGFYPEASGLTGVDSSYYAVILDLGDSSETVTLVPAYKDDDGIHVFSETDGTMSNISSNN